jgi:feruloyl-CoA synthase
MQASKFRELRFGITKVQLRSGDAGVQFLKADQALETYPQRLTDRFLHWAEKHPKKVMFARREKLSDGKLGDWVNITYEEALTKARSIAQFLINRKLDETCPVLILSENGLEHALLALGCMYAGVPYCPASPAYSLISKDFEKLKHIFNTLTPGLVFASDAERFKDAIAATHQEGTEIVIANGQLQGQPFTPFNELLHTPSTPAVEERMLSTGPDTIVKFLFTSGSTKLPKAVINTQRMWCANQQQMTQSMPVLAQEELILVDWLPWNHTFGGNHNFGMVIYNGGTMYLDDGKPTPALMHETLRNLREIAPTVYFNVPTGFEAIANALKVDDLLRQKLLSRVKMFFFAGAALAQPIWDSLFESQEREIGERIVMSTGLGMTESGPFAIFITNPNVQEGHLGVPTAGLELKLVPNADKIEVRYKGPNITPGYWRSVEETKNAFDEDGFFCTGDAVKWIDDNNIHLGLKFDGRIAEDFKLATGTFVSVGPLRGKIIAKGAPYIQDVVLTGINKKEVGAMIFPTPKVRQLAQLNDTESLERVLTHPKVLEHYQGVLDSLAKEATGGASRIARAILLSEAPSIDKGEVTDKGSINQRAVLKHRGDLVERLHNDDHPHILKPNP